MTASPSAARPIRCCPPLISCALKVTVFSLSASHGLLSQTELDNLEKQIEARRAAVRGTLEAGVLSSSDQPFRCALLCWELSVPHPAQLCQSSAYGAWWQVRGRGLAA